MDCIKAQELISLALDDAVGATDDLQSAKEHCRTCPDCGAFVKTLVALRDATSPEPRADLVDRIMVRVSALEQRSRDADSLQAETVPLAQEQPAEAPSAMSPAMRVIEAQDSALSEQTEATPAGRKLSLTGFGNKRSLAVGLAAAAVVLVAAGVGSVLGIKAMFGTGGSQPDGIVLESTAPDDGEAAAGSPQTGAADQYGTVMGAQPQQDALKSTSGTFIVVSGVVYRAAGTDASVSKDSLSQVGSTRTSLVSGSMPRQEPVLGAGDPARVFITSANGEMLAFDRVTTSFEGRTYALRGGEMERYGEMVSLPSGISEPTSADGYPTFEAVEGSSGVFVKRGQDSQSGIAYAPGTKSEYSPGWTWWEPAQQ